MASQVSIGEAQFPEGTPAPIPINSQIFWFDVLWSSNPGSAFRVSSVNVSDTQSVVTMETISPTLYRVKIDTGRPLNVSQFVVSIQAGTHDNNPQAIRTFRIDSETSNPIWRDIDWIDSDVTQRDIEIPTYFSGEVNNVQSSDFQLRGVIDGQTYSGSDYIRAVNLSNVATADISTTPIIVSIRFPPDSFGIVNLVMVANSSTNARATTGPAVDTVSPRHLVFDTRVSQALIDTADLESDWRVLLLGQDISEYIEQVRNVVHRLDLESPTEFKISNSTLHIVNEDGLFSPDNPDNFFVEHGGAQNGYKSEVTIISGFVGGLNNNILMQGEVIEVRQEETTGTFAILISEKSQDLRNEQLNDFGLTKYASVQESGSKFHGRYPYLSPVIPISDNSVKASQADVQLNETQSLKKEGIQNVTRFVVRDSVIETEVPFGSGTTVATEFKAPYRNKTIEYLVKRILEYYEINNYNIDIPDSTGDPSFTTRGRIGYDTERNVEADRTSIFGWRGYVTDYLYEENNNQGFGLGNSATGIAWDGTRFWGYSNRREVDNINRIFQINPNTGIGTWFSQPGLGVADLLIQNARLNRAAGLTYWRGYLWTTNRNGGNRAQVHRINPQTNETIRINQYANPTQPWTANTRGHITGIAVRDDTLYLGARQGIGRLEFNDNLTAAHVVQDGWRNWTRNVDGTNLGGMQSITWHNNAWYATTLSGHLARVEYGVQGTQSPVTIIGRTSVDGRNTGGPITSRNGELWGALTSRLCRVDDQTAEATPIESRPYFWFLYSSPDTATFPSILEYDVLNDSFRVAYRHNSHAEFWGLATSNFIDFYILATENTSSNPASAPKGTYDGGEALTSQVKIFQWNKISNTRATWIDPANVTNNPQLAQFYHFGFGGGDSRHGARPDTRKTFEFTPEGFYYIWANNSQFGLAQIHGQDSVAPFVTINKDNRRNHMGLDWTIDGNTLYVAHTKQGPTDSHLMIYSIAAP